jgi:hypothetical protein
LRMSCIPSPIRSTLWPASAISSKRTSPARRRVTANLCSSTQRTISQEISIKKSIRQKSVISI